MNRYPVKIGKRVPRNVDKDSAEVIPREAAGAPFLSFHYSHTEISTLGSKARVKSREARYESGKLTCESFDGEVDRTVYDQMIDNAQRYFTAQAALLFGTFSALLPLSRSRRSDRD
jgi:hypothetical protein